MADGGHQFFHNVVVPTLVHFDPPPGFRTKIGPSLAVDAIDGKNHALPCFDPLGPVVQHMKVFKIKEPAALTGNEYHGFSAVTVDLIFHFTIQKSTVMLSIRNLHPTSHSQGFIY
jgi:hypothetical protein